jgi:hypothetical protein
MWIGGIGLYIGPISGSLSWGALDMQTAEWIYASYDNKKLEKVNQFILSALSQYLFIS